MADTLHKQLSIAGTEFPLWCFEVMNTDAVEASGLDGSWLKIVSLSLCLLDFTVQCSAVPCETCISKNVLMVHLANLQWGGAFSWSQNFMGLVPLPRGR